MNSCQNCFWCRFGFATKKIYKCKLNPSKRFNKPKINGLFCKHFIKHKMVDDFKGE